MTTAPTKRQFKQSVKDAIAYKRIPDNAEYMGYRYGSGYTAQYGVYFRSRGLIAPFRQRDDGSFFLGHADEIDVGSHMERTLVAWEPMK